MFAWLKRYSPGPPVYLFAAGLVVRLYVLFRLTASPFLLPSRGDMFFYNDWALRILHGQASEHLAFYGLPLYAYLLAGIYRLFGYTPFLPALCQVALDAGTAVVIYQITVCLLSGDKGTGQLPYFSSLRCKQTIGLLAGIGWILFVPAQAYSVILMPTAGAVFVFWLIVWRNLTFQRQRSWWEHLATGLLIGVTAMGIATVLFLIPLQLWTVAKERGFQTTARLRGAAAAVSIFLLGIVTGMSPCWWHNYMVAHDPVLLSAHSGLNFWIGNNPAANGYPRLPPGLRAGQTALLQDSITRAEAAARRPLKRSEVSEFWASQARNYIATHFTDWLRLLGLKIRNLWNAFRYDDLSVITTLQETGVLIPGISFGFVAALAIPGIILCWRLLPRSRLILAAIALQMAALLPVFVTERYRLPMVPGLLVFAAIGVAIFWQSLADRRTTMVLVYCALLTLSTVVVSSPQRDVSLWALDAYNSGWQALEAGDLGRAEKRLQLAYAYVPANPETNFALGNLRLAEGKPNAADDFYRRTLGFEPEHEGALNNLAVIALNENKSDEAIAWLSRALAVNNRNGKTHFLLAKALIATGDPRDARSEIDQAIALNPQQSEFRQLRSTLP